MVSIGVIGMGKWGYNHVNTLANLGHKPAAIADPAPHAQAKAASLNVEHFSDYRKMLPTVEAVVIAAPTNLHYRIALDCLQAGKHVLVEKPIAETVVEGKKLQALAAKKKRVLAVGQLFRFNPALAELKRQLKEAGRPHYLTARFIHSSNPPRTDSGAIDNFGTHAFDWLNYLLDAKPKKVFALKHHFLSREREDAAVCLLDYGKFFASVELGWLHPLKRRDVWLIAEKNKVHADLLEQRVEVTPIMVGYEGNQVGAKTEARVQKTEPLEAELIHFLDCIETGKRPLNDAQAGLDALEVCLACHRAAETGKPVDLK